MGLSPKSDVNPDARADWQNQRRERPDWPRHASRRAKGGRVKTVLHLGAHRTGTTSFQSYMRRHAPDLAARGIGFWGPWRTRTGLFEGITPGTGHVQGADACLRQRLQRRSEAGMHSLLISDENFMGSVRDALKKRVLYPRLDLRLERYAEAFDGQVDRLVLSVRALDDWWLSANAFAAARGAPGLSRGAALQIALGGRSWQDVITDVAKAFPDAALEIVTFDAFANDPAGLCSVSTGLEAPRDAAPERLNAAPAIACPFTGRERAALRERFEDDLFWLRAGAGGLATFHETRPQAQDLRKAG